MGAIRFGPARVPSRESPDAAVELLVQRGYAACQVDFEGGFWMDWTYGERLGALSRERDSRLSVHAPIAAFLGHPERDRKYRMAIGMLDHSAGIAVACGAEPVVIHPGFLSGRERRDAIAAVVEQLSELRRRLEPKGRAVAFGVDVMGRARPRNARRRSWRSPHWSRGYGRCSTSPTSTPSPAEDFGRHARSRAY